MVKFVVMAGSALAMLSAGTAFGQSTTATGNSQIGSLTCGDIASLPLANQAALIYYAAGYRDGLVDGGGTGPSGNGDAVRNTSEASGTPSSSAMDMSGMSSSAADSGMSSAEGGSDTSSQSGASDSGAPDSGLVGGLGLDAQLVVTACTTSADALLTDVIGTSGGTSGAATNASGSSSSSDASSNTGASSEASGTSETSAAGDSGTSGASSSAQ